MTDKYLLFLPLLLMGCGGSPTSAPDAGDDGAVLADASTGPSDAEADSASMGEDAAPPVAPGECRPWKDGRDHVSSGDCAPYFATPVCDALTSRCVAKPTAICGACRTDADCQAAQSGSSCVFIREPNVPTPGEPPKSDQACLWPCGTPTLSCNWLEERWGTAATCYTQPAPDLSRWCLRLGSTCRGVTGERLP